MANQFSPGYSNQRSLVAEYLAANPNRTALQIGEALGIDKRRVSHLLFVLKEEGRVVGVLSGIGRGRAQVWAVSAEELQSEVGLPRRIVVQQWPRPEHAPKTWASPLEWVPA